MCAPRIASMPIARGALGREADRRREAGRVGRIRVGGRPVTTGVDGKPAVRSSTPASVPPRLDAGFDDGEALAFVLDQMPVGVFLLDGAGRVVWMNQYAQARIRTRDGITLCDGRLAAHSHRESAALAELVERAVAASSSGASRDPETIALSRPSEAFLVMVVRPSIDPVGAARGAARRDLRAGPRQRPAHLPERLPGPLRAHAGREPSRLPPRCGPLAASRLPAARHHERSARTYLKHVFEKTGTQRQAELVRLALAAATAGAGDS
jgi:PAS domain-containing protein